MDKGIRPYAVAYFATTNAKRVAGEFGPVTGDWYADRVANKAFRKDVLFNLADTFGISADKVAPSHYNYALKETLKTAPETILGLCRPEDKKGGRKKKVDAVAAPAEDDAATTADVLDSNLFEQPEADADAEAEAAPQAEAAPAGQTVFTVKKKKDGSVVAEGLSFEDARDMIARAAAAKKAKLYWV